MHDEARAVSAIRDSGSLLGRLTKNSLIVFATQVFTKALLFAVSLLIARRLGPAENGKFAFSLSLTLLFSVVATFGMDQLLVREVSRRPRSAGSLAVTSAMLRLLFASASLGLMAVSLAVVGKPWDVHFLTLLLGGSMAFGVLGGAFLSAFEGCEVFHTKGILQVVGCALKLVLAFWLLSRGHGLFGVGLAFLLSDLAQFAAAVALAPRIVGRITLGRDVWAEMGRMLREAAPFVATHAFVMVYWRVDTILLSLLRTDVEVGWYDAAHNIVHAFRLIPFSGAAAALPAMSRLFVADRPRAIRLFQRLLLLSVGLGLPITLGTLLVSEPLILRTYGPAYAASVPVLRILVWVSFMMFVNAFMGTFLVAANRQSRLFFATAVGGLSNLALNMLLIPRWSVHGAAITAVMSECAVLLACLPSVMAAIREGTRDGR